MRIRLINQVSFVHVLEFGFQSLFLPHWRFIFRFDSGNKFGNNNKFGNTNNKFQKGKFQNGQGKFQKPAPGKFVKPDGEAKPAPTEKVDWNKFKQEKKELRLKRKSTKTGFEKINEAKQIYEKLKW